jgi:hypothetical protein
VRSDGTYIGLTQDICTEGSVYEYSIEVTDVTAGGISLYGGGVILEEPITSTGVYTGHFKSTSTTVLEVKRYTGTTDVTFDNISIRQVNGNPATLVNTPTFSTDTP